MVLRILTFCFTGAGLEGRTSETGREVSEETPAGKAAVSSAADGAAAGSGTEEGLSVKKKESASSSSSKFRSKSGASPEEADGVTGAGEAEA